MGVKGVWGKAGLVLLLALGLSAVASAEMLPPQVREVGIENRLGQKVPLDLEFVDHEGRTVRVGDLLAPDTATLLTLNYYGCSMLCSLQLNALVTSLRELGWHVGDKFRLVTLSIDPQDDTVLAAAKRSTYLKELGQEDANWTFLTGREATIKEFAAAVGFGYQYVPENGEFAHAAAVYSLAPDGTITKVLMGIDLPAQDLKFAIIEGSQGTVGSWLDRVVMTCFHYDDLTGRYTPMAFGFVRLGGAAAGLFLLFFLSILWRWEHRRSAPTAGPLEAMS